MGFLLSIYIHGGNTMKGEELFKWKDVTGQMDINWSETEILKLLFMIGQWTEAVSRQILCIHRKGGMTTWEE